MSDIITQELHVKHMNIHVSIDIHVRVATLYNVQVSLLSNGRYSTNLLNQFGVLVYQTWSKYLPRNAKQYNYTKTKFQILSSHPQL